MLHTMTQEQIDRNELIKFILKYDPTRDLEFLKIQSHMELEDIKETTRDMYLKNK